MTEEGQFENVSFCCEDRERRTKDGTKVGRKRKRKRESKLVKRLELVGM
jgi:hypothetical protein